MMPIRFSKVDEGVYRGGEPSVDDLRVLKEVYGIQKIITLDGDIGIKLHPYIKELGIKHIILPIGGPESKNVVDYLQDNILDLLTTDQPVYIHCRHGKDRTGIAIALYREAKGMDKDKALEEAEQFGFGSGLDTDIYDFYVGYIKKDGEILFNNFKTAEKIDIDNLKKKYPDLSEEINSLISSDPSGRNIYLLWSIKQLLKDFSINDIIPTIKLFHDNKQSLNKKDINQYSSLKELEDTIKERLEKRQTRKEEIKGKLTEKEIILKQLQELQEKEENIIKTGTELIAESEDHSITLRFIKEKSASQLLGKDTSWCISMCKPGVTYYEQYVSNNVCFYFLENKNLDSTDPKYKIAIAIQRNIDNKIIKTELYNKTDNIIGINELDKMSQDFIKIAEQDAPDRSKGILTKIKNEEATKEEVLKAINIYNNPESQDVLRVILQIISYRDKYKDILSESFIRKFKDKVNWWYVSMNQKLSESFIKEFKDKVNWYHISRYQNLSESFIREFKDKIDWSTISIYQKLSESFIREFKDNIYWPHISGYQKLSEPFIREFKDNVYWPYISKYQKLSESFIREFKDEVDWLYIPINQKLSPEFKKEFKHKLGMMDINEVKDDDIVDVMRDQFEFASVPAASNPPSFVSQQSWSPDADRDHVTPPADTIPNEKEEVRKMRKLFWKSINKEDVKDTPDVPAVGLFDNYGGIVGAGPVENSGVLNI